MKSTLADIKQLFNVKAIAAAGLTPTAIPDGQLGVVDEATGLTVVPANFAALPQKFFIVSKLNGKIYYSFDTIEKEKIKNKVANAYVAPVENVWETIIESCSCMKIVKLVVNIDEASLMQRDGLTWTHRDSFVEVNPEELKCYCDCSGKYPVYENNVLTMLLAKKVNAAESPFYYAEVLNAEDDTVVADVEAFVESNKEANLDEDEDNNGPLLKLVIKGKPVGASNYNDLEVNYVYPRGVRLTPVVTVGDEQAMQFTETQAVVYEIGGGYDLRAEEWENMNHYTNLNYFTRLSDGIQAPGLVYQFENGQNYRTVNFEFLTDKVETNNGDKRLFGVLFGTTVAGVHNSLKAMFGL